MRQKPQKAHNKIIFKIIVLLILFLLPIHLFCGIPFPTSIDDSKLALEYQSFPDAENGYLRMVKAVGNMSDFNENRKKYYNDLFLLEQGKRPIQLTDKQAAHLKAKYGSKLRELEESVQFKYFVAPKPNFNYEYLMNKSWARSDNFVAVRLLSLLEVALVRYDYRKGNTAKAMKRLDTLIRLGNRLQTAHGSEFTYYTGLQVQSRCFKEINELVNDNLIPENQLPYLFNKISAKSHLKSGLQYVMKLNYNYAKVYSGHIRYDNEIAEEPFRTIDRLFYRPTRTIKKYYNMFIPLYEWAGRSYSQKPSEKYKYPKSISERTIVFFSGNFIDSLILFTESENMHKSTRRPYWVEAQSLLLRIRIALLLYNDRNETLPTNLDTLVPEYLPAVPHDPFDGKQLRYNPKKNIIYSVGFNLKDDGGNAEDDIFAFHSRNSEMNKDLVLHLMKTK